MMNKFTPFFAAALTCALAVLLSSPRTPASSSRIPEREDHAWEMFEWWYSQRALPNDLIPQGAFERAARYAATAMKSRPRSLSSVNAPPPWVSIGPTNVGGRTLSLAVNPSNTQIVWAGSASGGLWKSTTGGEGAAAWNYVPTGYPALAISTIAIDSVHPAVMYVGTGEISGYHRPQVGTPGARSSYGLGILKSTDGGSTWNQTSLTWTFQQITAVEKIVINPRNPNTLYAATSEGVYKSTDAGNGWFVSDTNRMAMDVAVNPLDTTIIYATHGNLNSTSNTGLFQSVDAGSEWFPLTNGLPSTNFGRAVLSIARSLPSRVYVGIANGATGQAFGLYRSDDDGGSWTQESSVNFTGSQGWYDIAVAVRPNNQSDVFSSGLDIYRSQTGGTSPEQETFWFQGGMGVLPPGGPEGPPSYAHADHHAIVFDPVHPDTIYFGTDGGVFKSIDGGGTYFGCNGGYVTTQFYNGFANALTDSTIALGGLQDNGVVKYEGSAPWNKVDGGDGGWCAIDPSDKNVLYDEYVYLSIKKSVNGGGFSGITSGLPANDATGSNFIAPFAISFSNPSILYAGAKNIFKTVNGGGLWAAANGGGNLNGTKIACIGVSYTSPDTLLAGTGSGSSLESPLFQIFASTNGGHTWTNVTGTLPVRYPTDIEFDPTNSATVYLTYSGYGGPHVFKSTNVGGSWTDITNNLPDIPHQSIAVDPAQPQHLYVGTDLGVYHSPDGGASWEDFSSGMVPAMVLDLAVSRSNGALRAATFGNGVYERKLDRTASLALVAPNGGEILTAGQTSLIRWSALATGPLKIEYSTNDGGSWNLVADNVPQGPGQYSWSVPAAPTTHARVRIRDSAAGTPADSSDNAFTIILNPDVVDGWNLISLNLRPPDPRKPVLFPTAVSPAFSYNSGYGVRDTLLPGRGYWLKFSGAQHISYAGDSIAIDTVPVFAGWNLIGSNSSAVPTAGIVQDPGGNVASPYFGYAGSYAVSTSLSPGKAYWVRVNANGSLILQAGPQAAAAASPRFEEDLRSATRVAISDAAGGHQALYLAGESLTSPDAYRLPPPAPDGAFDARFSSGRMLEFADPTGPRDVPLRISTGAWPVRISWDGTGGGNNSELVIDGRAAELSGPGEAVIASPRSRVSVRVAAAAPLPAAFALEQNYPNPFNPVTSVTFDLPRASVVTLRVYDAAGRMVAGLLERRLLGAGRQLARFDAANLASGVYFYRLVAEPAGEAGGRFESSRKMLLVR